MMAKYGYEIGEQARPYCIAAAELLKEHTADAWPVQIAGHWMLVWNGVRVRQILVLV